MRQDVVERVTVLPPLRLDIGGDAQAEACNRGPCRANLYRLAL